VVSRQALTYPMTDVGAASGRHDVDFEVRTTTQAHIEEVRYAERPTLPWLKDALAECGYLFLSVAPSEMNSVRVRNARDLYATRVMKLLWVIACVSLPRSMTWADYRLPSLTAVREGRAMETIASMILHGHLDVDLDGSLLGPDTAVRRTAK